LTRRGLALPAALAAVELSRQAAAAVPVTLAEAVARTAARFAASQTAGVPENVVTLTQEMLKTMSLTRMKIALLALLALCGTVVAAGLMTQAPSPKGPTPVVSARPRTPPQPPAAVAKVEFEKVTVVTRPSFRSNRTRETVQVSADGTCLYEVPERPARGE